MFKKMRGVRIPYTKQGIIYFTCRDYADQSTRVQQKIDNLCMEVAGEHYAALRDILITGKSIRQISFEQYIEERTLYRLRKKFYEKWKNTKNSITEP
jgi:glutathione peroxidase-family protein